ncbi:hypothetical protein [Nonomuraea pusilla]|uniref:hypothetical protein n=1 Tax=Nonomuraea pusilla TaxID=46177 RepID=UPI0011605589|nr:hypothetical protein [Nonomuraea pusilla]
MLVGVVVLMVLLQIPLALACCSVVLAALSAPRRRHGRVRRRYARVGAASAAAGLAVLAFAASSTAEDQHYDDFGSAMTALAAMAGGGLLVLGLGPAVPWLLGLLGRQAARLPSPFRPAARHLAAGTVRAALAVTTTVTATAIAVTVTIVSAATTAQDRARYVPEAVPGALVVGEFGPAEVASVRAAVEQRLPGVPVVERGLPRERVSVELDSSSVSAPFVGDQALLRYLTGAPPARYDEGVVVVVTADGENSGSVRIRRDSSDPGGSPSYATFPAVTVRPADPRIHEVFVPAKIMHDLGIAVDPLELIIDPAVHRATQADQERLEGRLGEAFSVGLEQDFQASTWWLFPVGTLMFIALLGALAAMRWAGSDRVLRRIAGGSAATLRLLAASRAVLGAACGSVMGTVAGCVTGLLLRWPMTTSSGWEAPPRAPFETPWGWIAVLAALPVLAAAIVALACPSGLAPAGLGANRGKA